jgi:signal transduction histidine kinase
MSIEINQIARIFLKDMTMSKSGSSAHSEKEKYQDFVNMTIHELKTPVTVMKAYLQMMLLQLNKDQLPGYVKTVEKMDVQLEKMLHLISDLQDGININADNIHCLMNDFSIAEALKSCIDNLKTTNPDLIVEADIQHTDLPVNADRDRIEQVINNFITNALKYSGGEKYLKIKNTVKDGRATVSIIDRGTGIPAEKQQLIFEQFYRVDSALTQKQPGLGLGLFICAEIIRKHNGEIGVNSKEGGGSEFWFSLPLRVPRT